MVSVRREDLEKLKKFIEDVSRKNFEFYELATKSCLTAEETGKTNKELMERIEELTIRTTELERLRLNYEYVISFTKRELSNLKENFDFIRKR